MSPQAAEPSELIASIMAEVLDSFEKLEVVMFLSRRGPPPSVAQLQASLDFPDEVVADAVSGLIGDGVICEAAGGLTVIEAGAWSPHCLALIALYRADRMQVATLMATAALTRLRSRTARAFSDAFVFRSRKGNRDG